VYPALGYGPVRYQRGYEPCSTKELDGLALRMEASETSNEAPVPVIRLPDRELTTWKVGLRVSPDGLA
jgi:hypothetical protein